MPNNYKRILKIVGPFCRLHWQLLISLGVAVATGFYVGQVGKDATVMKLVQPNQALSVLGVIGAILALASSISYGHLIHFISDAKTELHSSYHQFKDQLNQIDDLVNSFSKETPVTRNVKEMTYKMKSFRLEDIPFFDEWSDATKPVMKELDRVRKNGSWNTKQRDLVAKMIYCEELLSAIGLASVKQMISKRFLNPVIKSLALLAGIMISGIGIYFLLTIENTGAFVASIPVFFASFSSLVFVETGFYIFRHTYEFSYKHVHSDGDGVSDEPEMAT